MITVLGISGSLRWPSRTHTMMDIALSSARESGARIELLDLRTYALPLFDPQRIRNFPLIEEVRERMDDAHAYVIGTPEYHGSYSGVLKNLFDYLANEISGKVCGLVVAAGTDQGISALSQLQTMIHYLHAWTLPYGVTASGDDFDNSGQLATSGIRDALTRLGRDVTVYGDLIYDRFSHDRVAGGGAKLGFAPWYAEKVG
ncbi:MAG TPA: NAD(P)H-dependent oxidoreductase [Armatimonadota bacterium]|nr:NAD(P)H-dependent oxidoreductase [Armatimonadota bacterium]